MLQYWLRAFVAMLKSLKFRVPFLGTRVGPLSSMDAIAWIPFGNTHPCVGWLEDATRSSRNDEQELPKLQRLWACSERLIFVRGVVLNDKLQNSDYVDRE